MKTRLLLLAVSQFFIYVLGTQTYAQRGGGNITCITANAGENKNICPAGSTLIGANSSSVHFNYSWTPSTGLSSSTIAQPTASPSQTTTYTLTVTPKNNLLDNGDFENGNSGFGTDYTYDITNNNYQRYEIANNPINIYPWWCNVFPSSGNNMLVIDGATSSSVRVWYQTVSVLPNTTYNFAGQFINFSNTGGNNDPNIVVTINGTMIYNSALPYSNCMWTTMNEIWQSGENDYSAEIIIYANPNVAGNGVGNDLAIDNLSFTAGECTMTSNTVTVTVEQKPVISPSGPIEWCYIYDEIRPLTLTSSPSSSYQWYKNGTAIFGATQQNLTEQNLGWDPVTFQPRNLVYTVANSCETSDPVTVIAKATSGVHVSQSGYSTTSYDFIVNLTPSYWWDPNFSITHSIGYPGNLSNIIDNNGYRKFYTNIQSGVPYPSTYRFTVNLHEFGCIRSYKYDITITGNPQPTIVRINGVKKIYESSIIPISENSIIRNSTVLLYPNPTKKNVTVNTKTPFIQIQLYNVEGILRKSYNHKGTTTTLDISSLQPGLYYLKILSKTGILTEKLIVQ
ncbi:MAG TPA: hypothetical protein DHW64_11415 [Chitinophagaceae bacterium]|nr:hypothetical protein [Chitinophagaceae bacterium]